MRESLFKSSIEAQDGSNPFHASNGKVSFGSGLATPPRSKGFRNLRGTPILGGL